MKNKYKSRKTSLDGMVFDSAAEARAYLGLKARQMAGEIFDLKTQVVFELAPAVRIQGRKRPILKYIADFTYLENGRLIVADAKGVTSATLAGSLISISSLSAASLCLFYGRMSRAWGFRGVYLFISLVLGVGALVAANPIGSVYMPDGRTPWAWPFELDGEFGGAHPGAQPPVSDPLPGQSRLAELGPIEDPKPQPAPVIPVTPPTVEAPAENEAGE